MPPGIGYLPQEHLISEDALGSPELTAANVISTAGADTLLAGGARSLFNAAPVDLERMAQGGDVPTYERIHRMDSLKRMNLEGGAKFEKAARSFVSGTRTSPTSRARLEASRLLDSKSANPVRDILVQLVHLTTDETTLADRVSMNLVELENVAPNATMHTARKLTQTLQALYEVVPKPVVGDDPQPQLAIRDWQPTQEQRQKFERVYRVAVNPMSVADDLAEGTLSPGAVAILERLHPEVLEGFRNEVMKALADSDKRLSPEQQTQYRVLMGAPLADGATSRTQQAYRAAQQQKNAPRPPTSQVRTAEQHESRGQRLQEAT